ncbi:MAG: HAD family hydrolase [Anaerolineaceae bacterium]|nr:HAD family hydrolase [Anaerolineaceae bacterium]
MMARSKILRRNKRKIDIVLFDLGSTLIYTDAFRPALMQQSSLELANAFQDLGYELDKKHFADHFLARLQNYLREREIELLEFTMTQLVKNLLIEFGYEDMPEEDLASALAHMYAITQAHWHAEEDALPTLETLKNEGYHLGLISNAADDNDVQKLVDCHGFRPYFELILVSAAVGYRKPHPRIFQMALDHWGARPEQVVMIGDKLSADILGANLAGITSVWITRRARGLGNRDSLDTIRPDETIIALAELPALLARIQEE